MILSAYQLVHITDGLRAEAREITALDGSGNDTEGTKADCWRQFLGRASSVAGLEELAPQKLDAIELHALKLLFVGTHSGRQQHVPEPAVLRPARACVIAVPTENAVQVCERELAHQGSSAGSDTERKHEQVRHRAREAPPFDQRLAQWLREAVLRGRTAADGGPLGGVRHARPPRAILELEIEEEHRAGPRAATRALVHPRPEFPRRVNARRVLRGAGLLRRLRKQREAPRVQPV